MFARYRRGSALTIGSAPQPNSSSNNNGNNTTNQQHDGGNDTNAAAASLEELRNALDRLDFLTGKIAGKGNSDREDNKGGANSKTTGGGNSSKVTAAAAVVVVRGKKIAPSPGNEKDNAAAAAAAADNSAGDANANAEKTNNPTTEECNDDIPKTAAPTNDDTATTKTTTANPKTTTNTTSTSTPSTINKYTIERSPSAAAADIRANTNANFLAVEPNDELEMIELLRRIAELVVLSERKAGQLLVAAGDGKSVSGNNGVGSNMGNNSDAKSNNKSSSDSEQSKGESTGESSSTSKSASSKEKQVEDETKKKRAAVEYNEDLAIPYLALFELFCERNALANIVTIVTGVAFLQQQDAGVTPQSNHGEQQSTTTIVQKQEHLLPPLTIATQAVQSISILIQNVSRATSLYFLLSNNRVNDLIGLPLHLYKRAELNALHVRYNEKYSSPRKRGKIQKPLQPLPANLMNYQSGEMGELTTHFVSFLKSLAMRVNAETLQFFLSFPLNENGGGVAMTEKAKSNPTEEEVEQPTEDEPTSTLPQSSTTDTNQFRTYLERRKVVEFPLYARALEFCTPEQDSFVRVTAMNVCMNIIRLATIHSENDDGSDDDEEEGDLDESNDCSNHGDSSVSDSGEGEAVSIVDNQSSDKEDQQNDDTEKVEQQQHAAQTSSLPTTAPSGLLQDAPTLPLQDCIAIAQYACHPQRVSDLVSPLCARLTSQFGQVEGTVRALEELNDAAAMAAFTNDSTAPTTATQPPPSKKSSSSSKSSHSSLKKQNPKVKNNNQEEERKRLRNTIQNLIANVQDELLLLDDLLKVGLLSLNEQAIEMMLATFVYPMLLQPLLLPLHRFSSSKMKIEEEEEGDENGEGGTSASTTASLQKGGMTPKKAKGRKQEPVIVLQSPPPFSSNSTSKVEESTSSNGNTFEFSSPNNSNNNDNNNKPQLHSSSDMDLAPSKTALFGISVIFHTISNPTLRHLLLTALLHPLSPEASGGVVIRAPPNITLPCTKKKRSCWSDDFQLEIRMEKNQARQSMEKEEFQRDVNVYTFGTEPSISDGGSQEEGGSSGNNNGDFKDTCVFILAPALVDMLRNNTSTCAADAVDNDDDIQTESTATHRRKNPYRNILLSSISGTGEMVALQPLATAALHAAVSSVDGSVVRTILFPPTTTTGNTSKPPEEDENGIVNKTLQCLCHGIMNIFVTYDGWWKAKFNTIAARTLMDVISNNSSYIQLANSMLSDIRLEAAEFLMTLPSALDAKSRKESADHDDKKKSTTPRRSPRSSPKNNSGDSNNSQYLETWLLDRFFFDQTDRYTNSVVENVCYLKEEQGEDSKKEQYRYGLQVLSEISITGTSSLLCEDAMRVVDNNMVVGVAATAGGASASSSRGGNTPFHCAASWALACLYLDAFCMKLSKMTSSATAVLDDKVIEAMASSSSAVQNKLQFERKFSYISATASGDESDSNNDAVSFSLAHISSKFAIAMLDEGGESSSVSSPTREAGDSGVGSGGTAPAHGSPVGLVGKAAFPCVCEVSSSFAPLFSGRTSISNEGIQWQSLYLVVVGKWAVLAEPGHGGSGGEGRVITACRLSCLAVKKDSSSLVNNKTPARRLLVAHASLDPRPPSLFLVDNSHSAASSSRGSGGGGRCVGHNGNGGPNLGPNGLRLTRSRMDLWFEDANAAGHACRVLSGKITKARARRGGRIRSALLAK